MLCFEYQTLHSDAQTSKLSNNEPITSLNGAELDLVGKKLHQESSATTVTRNLDQDQEKGFIEIYIGAFFIQLIVQLCLPPTSGSTELTAAEQSSSR